LRHCATTRKVAGSLPDCVNGIFHWLKTLRPHYDSWVDTTSKRNEYLKYFLGCKGGRCAGLTLLPSCARCVEIQKPQPPAAIRDSPGL
jgi:hypothetical protein